MENSRDRFFIGAITMAGVDIVKTKKAVPFICFTFMVILQGCIPALSWIKDEEETQSQVYRMPVQVVWDAVPLMIKELGARMVDENKKGGYFLAETKMSALSHGEKITIVVKKVDETNTRVNIQSKRIWSNDTAATNWGIPMFNKLDEMLGGVKISSPPLN